MPYLVVTTWFPNNKAIEVANTYLEERKKYPRDKSLGKVVVEAIRSEEKGMMTMAIMDLKEGKLEEAITRQQNILVMYHNIEGHKYKIDVWWNPAEALSMVGMKAPED